MDEKDDWRFQVELLKGRYLYCPTQKGRSGWIIEANYNPRWDFFTIETDKHHFLQTTSNAIKELVEKEETTIGDYAYFILDGEVKTTEELNAEAQVVSAKKAHTNDVWQERWWQMFLKFSPSVFEGKDYWSHVVDMTNLGIKEAREEMERFFKEEEK